MKKTYFKHVIREVRFSLGRFFSIFGIVALGVGFLAGLLGLVGNLASLALYETGRVREAIPLLEKAIEIAPDDARLQENLRLMRAELRRG